jgi:hypothetical protein
MNFSDDVGAENTARFAAYDFVSPTINIEIVRDLVNAVTVTLDRDRREFFAI